MWRRFQVAWRLTKPMNTAVWAAAEKAVQAVQEHRELQSASKVQEQVRYCPSCGQIPDGDRRMDHARQLALELLAEQPRRSELDFAISFYVWRSKL